jgi:hypothetical protein
MVRTTNRTTGSELRLDISSKPKRQVSSRSSTCYSSRSIHPVPQPLTLQGEKKVDDDYPQSPARQMPSTAHLLEQTDTLKDKLLITELFEDDTIVKPVPSNPTVSINNAKQAPVRIEKRPSNISRNVKTKMPIKSVIKHKTAKLTVDKSKAIKDVRASTANDNTTKKIIVAGTDWLMAVEAKDIHDRPSSSISLYLVPEVAQNDLLSHEKNVDTILVSQSTVLTNTENIPVSRSVRLVLYKPSNRRHIARSI